jgi:tripartite motif-containing protein 71
MKLSLWITAAAFALASPGYVNAGKPFEVEYPNIVAPAAQFGSFGADAGQFNEPSGLAISTQREIVVADCFNRRIQFFDYGGRFLRAFASDQLACPQGVAIDEEGRVYVADSKHSIFVFTEDGSFLNRFATYGSKPGYLINPTNLAVHKRELYVTDQGNNRISVFGLDGNFARTIGHGGKGRDSLLLPKSVTVDQDGFVYVVDHLNRVKKFDSSGRFLKQWGRYGGMPGELAEPADLSAANRLIYVADLVNHRLQAFHTDGRLAMQWGRHPEEMHEGLGRTHYPSFIKASAEVVVVCEPFEYRCQVFETKALRNLPQVDVTAWWQKFPKFHYGTGVISTNVHDLEKMLEIYPDLKSKVSVSPSARPMPVSARSLQLNDILFITEPDIHRLVSFDVDTSVNRLSARWSVGSFGKGPLKWGMLAGKSPKIQSASLLVSDAANHVVQELDLLTGTYKATHFGPGTGPGEFNGPTDVAEAPNGDLYIGDYHNNRIQVFDKNFKFKFAFGKTGSGKGELFSPMAPRLDRTGEQLYVSDTGNNRVVVFNKNGDYLFEFGRRAMPGEWGNGTFLQPFDIAVGRKGDVYVTDPAMQLVQRFSADGKFLMQWGGWGTKPGQFYKCKGIAVGSDGKVYVIDFGNHRGQIFTENGEFLAIFGEGFLFPKGMLDEEGKPKPAEAVSQLLK